jgi:pre-mRNA-splicing factor CWC22
VNRRANVTTTGTVAIHDHTGTNLVNLRRRIYLTIMSALDFEEAVHKLLKMELPEGQEVRGLALKTRLFRRLI